MGLSPRNLWDMKRFYERYNAYASKLRQLVSVLPWGHNLDVYKRQEYTPLLFFRFHGNNIHLLLLYLFFLFHPVFLREINTHHPFQRPQMTGTVQTIMSDQIRISGQLARELSETTQMFIHQMFPLLRDSLLHEKETEHLLHFYKIHFQRLIMQQP